MHLRLVDVAGPFLTGRTEASRLRDDVLRVAADDGEAVVDLDGVQVISPSFADEFFAKIPADVIARGDIRVEHLTAELETVVRTVTAHRAQD